MAAIAITTRCCPQRWLSSNRACSSFVLHKVPKQVLYLPDTCESDLKFSEPYHTVKSVKELDVRTVRRGFQRRPELIQRRRPEFDTTDSLDLNCMHRFSSAAATVDENLCLQRGPRLVNNLSYGLYEKCERIQHELTNTTLQLMGLTHLSPVHIPEAQVEGAEGMTGLTEAWNNDQFILDIGCGYGFSLTKLCKKGVCVVGVDMDLRALSVLRHKTHTNYLPSDRVHVVRTDVTQGLCFRDSVFDWAISISFLQWLCATENPLSVLQTFFQSLSFVLKSEACAGIQFYPKNACDVQNVLTEAEKHFKGALVSDYPHIDRGRKLFLILIKRR